MSETTANFGGLRVGAFESRRAEEMARLIERFGGVPQSVQFPVAAVLGIYARETGQGLVFQEE